MSIRSAFRSIFPSRAGSGSGGSRLEEPALLPPVLPSRPPNRTRISRLELEGVHVQALLHDTPSVFDELLGVYSHPRFVEAGLALQVAQLYLDPACSASTSSPSEANWPRAVLALLLGLRALLDKAPSADDKETNAQTEELLESLVGVFVRGGVRSTTRLDLPFRLVAEVTGGLIVPDSGSLWSLTRTVIEALDRTMREAATDVRTPDEDACSGLSPSSRRRIRIEISTFYLLSLLAPRSSPPDTTLSRQVVLLGLAIDCPGVISPPSCDRSWAPLSGDDLASSLVWKSRKRIELAGDVETALLGLPSGGGAYERWSGGAVEIARAREKEQDERRSRRKALVSSRSFSSTRPNRRSLSRLTDGELADVDGSSDGAGGSELLAAPRRLKGKKIVEQRRGYFQRAAVPSSSGSSSSGPSTPGTPTSTLYKHRASTSISSFSSVSSSPVTSLPSLHHKRSIDLLRMNSTPTLRTKRSMSSLHIDLTCLKSSTPIPLPSAIDSVGIFSPVDQDIGFDLPPSTEGSSGDETESATVTARPESSWATLRGKLPLLSIFSRQSSSELPLSPGDTTSSPPDSARGRRLSRASSSSSSPRPISPLRATPTLDSLSSSASTSASTLASPITIAGAHALPKIAFQPSSYYGHGPSTTDKEARELSFWRPLSPRGERLVRYAGKNVSRSTSSSGQRYGKLDTVV